MASGTADLQRDLGGAIMQSIFGALLTAGYAAAVTDAIAGVARTRRRSPTASRTSSRSRSRAPPTRAQQYPQYSKQIIAGAKQSFLDGQDWAYTAGIIAMLLGAALVFFFFPKQHHEDELLASYRAEDRRSWQRRSRARRASARIIRSAVWHSPHRANRSSSGGRGHHPTGLATCRYGTVGPSTALVSMLMVTPPYASSWPPTYWCTRWWLFHSESDSAHGAPNP